MDTDQNSSPASQGAPTAAPAPSSEPQSPETLKNIFVILMLLLFFPIGLILMWVWTKWKIWVKIVLTIVPVLLIPVLAIFLAIVLIAINPASQFAKANDTQRKNDVNAMSAVISQYVAEKGKLPAPLDTAPPNTPFELSSSNPYTGKTLCDALVPTYVVQLPKDPQLGTFVDCSNFDTKYTLTIIPGVSGSLPQVTVSAPNAQVTQGGISVTR